MCVIRYSMQTENDRIDIIAVSRMDGFLERTLFKNVASFRCTFHRNAPYATRIAFSTPRIACLLRILQSKLLTLNTSWMLHKPPYLDFVAEHFSSSRPRKNWQRFMVNCFPAAPRCACHCSENYAGLFPQRGRKRFRCAFLRESKIFATGSRRQTWKVQCGAFSL